MDEDFRWACSISFCMVCCHGHDLVGLGLRFEDRPHTAEGLTPSSSKTNTMIAVTIYYIVYSLFFVLKIYYIRCVFFLFLLLNGMPPMNDFVGYLAKSLNWDQYNNLRVGRHPQLQFNRVTEPAKDLHLQDIKALSLLILSDIIRCITL